jgi:hypothetical protein
MRGSSLATVLVGAAALSGAVVLPNKGNDNAPALLGVKAEGHAMKLHVSN